MEGPPPIHIVPVETSKPKGKSVTVQIKIRDSLEDKVAKFADVSCEEALCHVQLF